MCGWYENQPSDRSPYNGHRIRVFKNELDENDRWEKADSVKNTYTNVKPPTGKKLSIEKYDKLTEGVGGRWYYRFMARATYIKPDPFYGNQEGCNPILRIQFLATEKNEKDAFGYVDKGNL